MPETLPSRVIAAIAFVGRRTGQVKTLGGFKKGFHTVPDVANAVTTAFLGKICAQELTAEAESLFQTVRSELAYKRRDISLEIASPVAVLNTKDFIVEFAYALEPAAPGRYESAVTLRELRSVELARTQEFSDLFSGRFSELRFTLSKGVSVEAVIDAIESLPAGVSPAVRYPSDCSDCEITVPGVAARVRFTGASVEMHFPRSGSPAELIDAFVEARSAFAVSDVLMQLTG